MIQTIAIALGGAAGAVGRYWVARGIQGLLGREFPYGTMAVNVFGSLLMGWLYILLLERLNTSAEVRALLLIGFLGAFTTFSTFSIETFNLIEQGAHWKAVLNVAASVVACVGAAWLGVLFGRTL